jgi:hypothetical protein
VPITPFPYQAEALRRVQQEFASGRQRTLVVMPTGCHHPNQHLLLLDGLSGMACNIHEGDVLLGPDSTPRHVVAVHEGEAPMYRIIPVKGEPFIVTGDHLLTLVRTNETSLPRFPCRSRGGEVVDVTVEDWLLWPDWRKHIHKLFRVPVEFTVPVSWATGFDPYLAGVLLGDGSLQSGRNVGVTSADSEMEVYCHSVARQYGATIRKSDVGGRCPTYFFRAAVRGETNRFLEAVRENGLYWMDSGTKYIPMQFRAGSLLDRYELLAGLMDTDGSLSCNGYDYPTKSSTLAYDVAFVARSVGLAAYVQECWKSCQTGAGGTYYRVSISGHTDMIPCRLPRKKASPRQQIKDVLRTGFTVEPLGVGEYRGFTVDGDNRYLLGDFTVTHNCGKTHTAAFLFRENVDAGGRNLFLTHRDPLVHQAFADLGSVGLDCAVEKGDQDARDDIERARHDIFRPRDIRTVVASVQTLHERRLPRWPAGQRGPGAAGGPAGDCVHARREVRPRLCRWPDGGGYPRSGRLGRLLREGRCPPRLPGPGVPGAGQLCDLHRGLQRPLGPGGDSGPAHQVPGSFGPDGGSGDAAVRGEGLVHAARLLVAGG